MKRKLTEITHEAHIIASPWFVGPSTPVQTVVMNPYEPPNKAKREEIESISPTNCDDDGK